MTLQRCCHSIGWKGTTGSLDLNYWSLYPHTQTGDFINSDEYRKPEWLIKMEEIKERLAGNLIHLFSAYFCWEWQKMCIFHFWLVRFFIKLQTANKLICLSPATAQAPKFIREIKDVRTKEGMRGKFEAGFAGHPKPDITWWFNGQQLQNSKNIQIKIRDDSTVLHIIDCGFDLAGYYECKAESDMGKDKCRASLTVNSK